MQALTRHFGSRAILDGVSLYVKTGESIAIVGAAGSGKSTLLKIVLGFISPDRGKVWQFPSSSRDRSITVGYQPQGMALPGNLSVRRFLSFCASISGVHGELASARVGLAIEACGLAHMSQRNCGSLNLLERRLVSVAQAGVARPDLLVLDEPAAGLDSRAAGQVVAGIERLRAEQQTLLVAAPTTVGLETLCDRAIAIFAGRIGQVPLGDVPFSGERLVVSLEQLTSELVQPLMDLGFDVDVERNLVCRLGTNADVEHGLLACLMRFNARIVHWHREPVSPVEDEGK